MLFLTYSCKKEITPVADNNSTAASLEIDYSKIKKTSGKANSMLIFESWEHFNNVKNTLSEQCNAHANTFFATVSPSLEDDDLNAYIRSVGYNQMQPLHDFANTLGFQSLYQLAEVEEQNWLAGSTGEELDFTHDPFSQVERLESGLLNTDKEVMIGSEIVSFAQIAGKTGCTRSADHFDNCTEWNYQTSLGWRKRKIKGNTGVRAAENISSTTTYFINKTTGNWDLWHTRITTEIYGTPYMNQSGTCGEFNIDENKKATLGKGFYVYKPRYTGSHSWGIKYENYIRSLHTAPGNGYNGGAGYYKGF